MRECGSAKIQFHCTAAGPIGDPEAAVGRKEYPRARNRVDFHDLVREGGPGPRHDILEQCETGAGGKVEFVSVAAAYAQSIENDPTPSISAASVFEAGIVLLRRYGPEALSDLQDLIEQSGLQIEPVTVEQAELALDAYQHFGKGRHNASLNFGDCFTYALAKAVGQPVLFKGNDFSQTDLEAVLLSRDEDEQA